MSRSALLEASAAGAAGLLLFALAVVLERALGTGPVAAALLEESGRILLLLAFGLSGLRAPAEGGSARRARQRAYGLARGLSLGLVATAVFAGAENLAYLAAFPEFGLLARLRWSLPVHLVASLLGALGILFLLRGFTTGAGLRRRLAGVAAGLAGPGLAVAWHGAANALAAAGPGDTILTAGSWTALALALVLLLQFTRHAYLGGFLHGAD